MTTSYSESTGTVGTSSMPKENSEGMLVWNPSVGLYHKPAKNERESYGGIVGALEDHIAQQSGGVTKGYPHNFAGIIAAIQDLNIAANEVPVTPDVKPDTGGEIIIKPDGTPEWIDGTDPEDGTLWFDTRQGRLFVAVDKNWWQTNGADGLAFTTVDATAPDVDPVTGQFWWDAGHSTLYVFDGQWIDASGNIEGFNDGNSTPLWRVVNSDPDESMQTTLSLPLGNLGGRMASYDAINDGGILPDADPNDFSVQADYNIYIWDALLALEQFSLNQSAVTMGEAPPADPKEGDLWYDTTTLDMSVWYTDDDTSQWAPINSPFNYDSDLDVVRSMIVEETSNREKAIDNVRQLLADFDAADNTQLLQLARDIETLGNRITVEAPDLTPYATTASVEALEIELKAAIANQPEPAQIDTSQFASRGYVDQTLDVWRDRIHNVVTQSELSSVEAKIPDVTNVATRDFVTETFDSITTTFLPRGGGNLTGSFTMVKEDYALPVFDFSTESWNSKQAFKLRSDATSTASTTFGTTEDPWEVAWEFGADEDFCWIYNNSKVFSVSKEGPACSTLILGDFSTNDQYGRSIRNKIDLKERLTTYQFALESIRQGVANATDFDSLKANILTALIDV